MGDEIGIIGLGLLGSALGERLLAQGHRVVGFDIDPARCTAFVNAQGQIAASARHVAERCALVLLSLPDSSIVAAVAEQLLSGAHGCCLIDTTTGDPDDTAQLGARLVAAEIDYCDATVVGSSQQARAGQIVLLVGGDSRAVARARPLLERLGRQWFHVGPVGTGARAKLIVNQVLGLNRAVLAEALTLARREQLDPHLMLEILRSGAAYSRVMDTKGPKMIEHDFVPEARLRQHHKDVRLILEQGARCGAWLPLSRLHESLLARAEQLGLADADNSAIVQVFESGEEPGEF